MKGILSALLLCSFLAAIQPSQSISTRQIISSMSEAAGKIKSLKFKLRKKERVNGELIYGEQEVKFIRSPKKIYTQLFAPNKGVEILYVEGQNNNKAYVNPGGFPYVTLSLDPTASTMRKNNHHTVNEVGFDYVNSIVNYIARKADKDFDKYFLYKGDTVFNGRSCYKVIIDYIPFAYIKYTVKEGEDLSKIAYKYFISDYMILQLNEDIDDYEDVEAGDVITIPNAYARKTLLYIDKETFLPLIQAMYDDKGLFARYEFYNVQINPAIPAEEFTKDYKEYHFK